MNYLNLSPFFRSSLASVCICQGILISELGLFFLPASANTPTNGSESQDSHSQPPVTLLEKATDMSGDRHRELFQEPPTGLLETAGTLAQSIEDPTTITESTLTPFIPSDASAALLLPENVNASVANSQKFAVQRADFNLPISPSSVVADNTSDNEVTDMDRVDAPEDDSEMETENPWTFKLQLNTTLNLSTYGSSTVRGTTVDYHLNFGEVLDILKVAASGRVEAWYNNLGFIFDGYYANIGGQGIVSFQNLPNTTIENKLTTQQGIYDFAISYRFGDTPPNRLPETPSQKNYPLIWFEPIAGVRLNDVNATLEESVVDIGDASVSATFERIDEDQGRTWFEPMLGGKLGVQFSDPIALWLRGDVSGFGLAGDTDLSWNLLGGIDWWVNRSISLQLGYKFYEIDYQNGSGSNAFGVNTNVNGPFLGATFYF